MPLAASTLALGACDSAAPAQRGFGSRQVVSLRDPTFEFYSSKGDLVFYRTGEDSMGQGQPTYWSLDVGTGETQNLGPTMPNLGDPTPPARYQCAYTDSPDGLSATYKVMDTETGVLTAIEHVYVTWPYCPTDDDPTLVVWRFDTNKNLQLWAGPYTYLTQVTLPFQVHDLFGKTTTGWLVSAPSPAPPNGLAVYSLPDQDLTAAAEIIPAVLGSASWAPGTAPTASPLVSSGLVNSSSSTPFLRASPTGYCYERAMDDGSTIMFVGPQAAGAPGELALFAVDTSVSLTVVNITPYSYRYDGIYRLSDTWTSLEGSPQTSIFRVWRDALGRFATCPWAGGDQFPVGLSDPAGENIILLEQQNGYQLSQNSPFMLVVPGAAGGDTCKLMAPTGVGYADFSPDGTALAWLVEPPDSKATLWTAARDGSGARALGTDYIDGYNYGTTQGPHFVGDSQLEMTLAGDLVWVDVHDDPVRVHYVTEQVFGAAIDLGRWVVTGHEYSDQDANGNLALVNRDTGQTREISPGVQLYTSPDVAQYGITPGVFDDDGSPIRVVYLVRGRNPSPQDGLWVATITARDRP